MVMVTSILIVNVDPAAGAAPAARAFAPGPGPGRLDPGRMCGVDAVSDQSPRRAHRRHRPGLGLLIDQLPDPGHAIGALRDRCRQNGEHHPRIVQPPTLVGIGQHLAGPGGHPDRAATSRNSRPRRARLPRHRARRPSPAVPAADPACSCYHSS